LQVLSVILVFFVVVAGLGIELKIGRANVDLNSAINRLTPDAEAGEWLGSQSEANAIVMARHVPTVFHYSKRTAVCSRPAQIRNC
jgi:hypothetical protein